MKVRVEKMDNFKVLVFVPDGEDWGEEAEMLENEADIIRGAGTRWGEIEVDGQAKNYEELSKEYNIELEGISRASDTEIVARELAIRKANERGWALVYFQDDEEEWAELYLKLR